MKGWLFTTANATITRAGIIAVPAAVLGGGRDSLKKS
jgi:hypothetical protein